MTIGAFEAPLIMAGSAPVSGPGWALAPAANVAIATTMHALQKV